MLFALLACEVCFVNTYTHYFVYWHLVFNSVILIEVFRKIKLKSEARIHKMNKTPDSNTNLIHEKLFILFQNLGKKIKELI